MVLLKCFCTNHGARFFFPRLQMILGDITLYNLSNSDCSNIEKMHPPRCGFFEPIIFSGLITVQRTVHYRTSLESCGSYEYVVSYVSHLV